MQYRYEIKKVPKVVLQSFKLGEFPRPVPIQQYWYVIEDIQTGERLGTYDFEQDALDHYTKLNK